MKIISNLLDGIELSVHSWAETLRTGVRAQEAMEADKINGQLAALGFDPSVRADARLIALEAAKMGFTAEQAVQAMQAWIKSESARG